MKQATIEQIFNLFAAGVEFQAHSSGDQSHQSGAAHDKLPFNGNTIDLAEGRFNNPSTLANGDHENQVQNFIIMDKDQENQPVNE